MRQLFRPSAVNATFQGTTLEEFSTVKLRVAAHPGQKNNLLRFYQGATEQKDQASFPNAQPQSREHVTGDVLTVCELKSLFACSTFREVPVTTQTRTHFVGQPLCDATK